MFSNFKAKFVNIRAMVSHIKAAHSVCAELLFHLQFCDYSSKYKSHVGTHIRRKHRSETNAPDQRSDSSNLELHKGEPFRSKYVQFVNINGILSPCTKCPLICVTMLMHLQVRHERRNMVVESETATSQLSSIAAQVSPSMTIVKRDANSDLK